MVAAAIRASAVAWSLFVGVGAPMVRQVEVFLGRKVVGGAFTVRGV